MIWLILLGFILGQIGVTPDTPIIITLNGDARPADLVYQADVDEQITIVAHSLGDEPIDVTLEVLQDEQRLAFNDDHQTEREGLSAQDSVIENLVFSGAGDYTIRLNSFNGAQSGDIKVIIESIPLAAPCEMPIQSGELTRNGQFSCTLSVNSDSAITINLHDISGTLDPVLRLLDEHLTQAAYNDDHASANFALNTLDSQISDFALSGGARYTVQVTDFSGAAGTFELAFEITP
jgi:hypothetical protein